MKRQRLSVAGRRARTSPGEHSLALAGWLALLGGCARAARPPRHGRAATKVQVDGRARPAVGQQSKAVLDASRRAARQHLSSATSRSRRPSSAAPWSRATRSLLLQDGPRPTTPCSRRSRGARDHINMETYILEDDEVGQRFADALIDKQRQGVQVNLIYDSVGAIGTPQGLLQAPDRQRHPRAGVQSGQSADGHGSGWDVNQRDHRKLLIVDGRTAFLGGINISSVYSGGSLRHRRRRETPDAGEPALARHRTCRSTGPVVAEFQKLFLATWDKQKGEPLPPRKYFPQLGAAGQGSRARHRQLARRAVQPDLRDADLGHQQRRDQVLADQRLFRARPAAARRAQGRRAARRRREAACCRARPIPGWCSTPAVRHYDELLRGRRQDLRAARRAAALQDRGDRRRVVDASARPTSTGAASCTTRR